MSQAVIAYFSAEFGIDQALPIYSGGLGILAGDHLKAASDLKLPLAAIGLLYHEGYASQSIQDDGEVKDLPAAYRPRDPGDASAPRLKPVCLPSGERLIVPLELGPLNIRLGAWELAVGGVRLFLLDADIPENPQELRGVTARLYPSDKTARLHQELILGIGGVRLLRSLGFNLAGCHLNEGHCSFALIELARALVAEGKARDLAQALSAVWGASLFTTHTPVEAGHDVFDEGHVAPYMEPVAAQLKTTVESLLALARPPAGGRGWNMAALALRLAGAANAVSRRHETVSRILWQELLIEEAETQPKLRSIGHVTNGVHLATWVHPLMAQTLDRALGDGWRQRSDEPASWQDIANADDKDLWAARCAAKAALVKLMAERAETARQGGRPSLHAALGASLDPNALTIGFARRFASYKRATLVLSDVERLKRILLSSERPVQIIFAGKAHPADEPGKALLREIIGAARRPDLKGRIAFVEDYDMDVAKALVAGCDVWLNAPIPPLEACGTSGQKAALNGALNLSVLDGWWEEAFNGQNGFAFGFGAAGVREGGSPQDHEDSSALYHLLEHDVVPLFFARGADGIPHEWLSFVKRSMATIGPVFNARRMIKDYIRAYYLPMLERAGTAPVFVPGGEAREVAKVQTK